MGDKKTTTNTTANQTQTTTPNVPKWGADSLQNLNTQINAIGNSDPQSFVTAAAPLQQQAYSGAGALGGWQAGNTAAQGTAGGIAGSSLLDGLDKYMNPYTDSVVNSTLANFDQQTGKTQAQMQADAAKTGAFGGSRYGVAQGDFAAQNNLNRAQTEAQLRDQAFNTGTGLSNTDRNTQLAAAGLLGKLSTAQNTNQL
jgi:hypothetical protein